METYQFKKEQNDFGKKVLKATESVYPYVKHRLKIAEIKSHIPKNMYKASDIVDDAIVDLYTSFEDKNLDAKEIKLHLFTLVDEKIKNIIEKEKFHKKAMPVDKILKEELQLLEEKFTVDADFDLIMEEELTDISYKQKDFKKSIFLYDKDAEQKLSKVLNLKFEDIFPVKKRAVLNKVYHWLPEEMSNIFDLHVFGDLSFEEIAALKKVEVSVVKDHIERVRELFIAKLK